MIFLMWNLEKIFQYITNQMNDSKSRFDFTVFFFYRFHYAEMLLLIIIQRCHACTLNKIRMFCTLKQEHIYNELTNLTHVNVVAQ